MTIPSTDQPLLDIQKYPQTADPSPPPAPHTYTTTVLNRLVQFNVIRHYVETNLFPYYS